MMRSEKEIKYMIEYLEVRIKDITNIIDPSPPGGMVLGEECIVRNMSHIGLLKWVLEDKI